ncbi:MAG TPA: hypothetical protein VFN09_00800 [Rhodanobacteraceae bacterium]|nr:hypothetical protein [Rhodanobacteraceae bacterium]
MGGAQTIWHALTTIIQMEDRVKQQADILAAQQSRIETLTERVIRLEAQMELLLIGAGAKPKPKRLR